MKVLVAYATRHGSTQGIAERIGETLTGEGHEVTVRPAGEVKDAGEYEALVIGSATYLGHWQKDATALVRKVQPALGARPVWLFSSGPLGPGDATEGERDPKAVGEPKELAELVEALSPREHKVFFGALDPAELGMLERTVRKHPAGRQLLPEGDFRDWEDIDGWAHQIADELGGR